MANTVSIVEPKITGGFLCDSEPVENSTNFVLSGAVYSAVSGLPTQGVAVADAAGDAPTAAEFKALLDSLRDAGVIATAESGE